MHTLFVGETGCGKTTTAVEMHDAYKARHIKTVVLDPYTPHRWNADLHAKDADQLVKVLRESRCCAVFIDECLKTLKRDMRYDELAGAMRHYGHRCHFLCQRFSQVTPGIRDNCQTLILFNCAQDFAKMAAREYNEPSLMEAPKLPKGYYLLKRRFHPVVRGKTPWA